MLSYIVTEITLKQFIKITLFLGLLILPGVSLQAEDDYEALRQKMIKHIKTMIQQTQQETGKDSFGERVMAAMAKVPRHQFVPESQKEYAYENRPLSIGHGQTISQPYIVALMTDFLNLSPDDVVLEVGTGSGYQAAILSELVKKVYTIEIIEKLGKKAQKRLADLGYDNVEVKIGDGYHGWEAHAPYDAIIVTAAASHIPPPLIQQLKPGGQMVVPVGERFHVQHLTLVEKNQDNKVKMRQVLPVAFVPLTGQH